MARTIIQTWGDGMKKLEFKFEDFFNVINHSLDYGHENDPCGRYASIANVLNVANKKFDEWFKQIEDAPVVYGICEDLNIPRLASLEWAFLQSPKDTHTARLIDIQEIKKKCEHKNKIYGHKYCAPWAKCNDCGVELVADWREK